MRWRLLSSPTNAQPDPPEVEHEHLHLQFLHAYEGKQRTLRVHAQLQQEAPDNKMDDHHAQGLHARSR